MAVDKVQLKSVLKQVTGTLRWLALVTPTRTDDEVVKYLDAALDQEWVVDLLVLLISRFASGNVNAEDFRPLVVLLEDMKDK